VKKIKPPDPVPAVVPEVVPDALAIIPKGKKPPVTLEKIIPLRERGFSFGEIGKLLGVTKQRIHQIIRASGFDPGAVAEFKTNKSSLIHHKQKLLLDGVTPEAVEAMCPRDRIVGFGILYDKARLEDGFSTSNVAGRFVSIDLTKIAARLDEKDDSLTEPKGEDGE